VTDRRQFLAGLAALPLQAAAGQPQGSTPTAESPVPCAEPTPGTVTDPRGSVGKTTLTDLVDAYSQVTGVDWQHQLYSTLSNKPGVCSRYRQNQVVAGEKWLVVIQTAYRSDMQPAPFAPGTYGIGVGTTGPDGTLRTAEATFQPFGRNCSEGGQQEATSGTVTYTTVTDTLVAGSYDLLFGRSRVTGSFTAPTCTLCAPRPTSRTCLKQ
jgi:hypothetical protein